MKILITGGAGFIGSHLSDALLAAGHEITIIDDLSSGTKDFLPKEAEFLKMDIRDEKLGYRIREAQMQKVPYMLVVGDKEAEGGDLALRIRDRGDAGLISLADLKEKLTEKFKENGQR